MLDIDGDDALFDWIAEIDFSDEENEGGHVNDSKESIAGSPSGADDDRRFGPAVKDQHRQGGPEESKLQLSTCDADHGVGRHCRQRCREHRNPASSVVAHPTSPCARQLSLIRSPLRPARSLSRQLLRALAHCNAQRQQPSKSAQTSRSWDRHSQPERGDADRIQ